MTSIGMKLLYVLKYFEDAKLKMRVEYFKTYQYPELHALMIT